jgi:hypothetical protein
VDACPEWITNGSWPYHSICPFRPRKRTNDRHGPKSVSCQKRKLPLCSITSSAIPTIRTGGVGVAPEQGRGVEVARGLTRRVGMPDNLYRVTPDIQPDIAECPGLTQSGHSA